MIGIPFGILFDCLYCWPQMLDCGELVVRGHRKIFVKWPTSELAGVITVIRTNPLRSCMCSALNLQLKALTKARYTHEVKLSVG